MLECANSDPDFLKTVMRLRCTVTTQKPRLSHRSGCFNVTNTKESKRSEDQRQNDAAFFFTTAELCITNMHQKAKLNEQNYQKVLHPLRDVIQHKRQDLWESCNWRLHHNSPAQDFLPSTEFSRCVRLLTFQ